MASLRLTLIHQHILYKEPKKNREALLTLTVEAARQGAQVVVAPEMSISGYSFTDHADVAPYAETLNGPTLSTFSHLLRELGIYGCFGMAEKDARTGMLYNSAFVLGPDMGDGGLDRGQVICRYRKINAESRWACPGNPNEDNTFETPWGRMGVLICSDTYYGLMPRITALRGADLLLVPANWPPSGLDPRELWKARALENGIYVAACNRTGVDRIMDCRDASSCVCDPQGDLIVDTKVKSEHHQRVMNSQIVNVDIPLSPEGHLDSEPRRQRLSGRRRERYHHCYRNLRPIRDLTSFLELPEPGLLDLVPVVPAKRENPLERLFETPVESYVNVGEKGKTDEICDGSSKRAALFLLPPFSYSVDDMERIHRFLGSSENSVLLARIPEETHGKEFNDATAFAPIDFHLFTPKEGMASHFHFRFIPESGRWVTNDGADVSFLDIGPARVQISAMSELDHPETAVAAAKQGCDLILCFEMSLTDGDALLAGARSIENIAVGICAVNRAGFWETPEGHARWKEILVEPEGDPNRESGAICWHTLDTRRTRSKRFQDNVDFERLFV